jgi:hypothetical protein
MKTKSILVSVAGLLSVSLLGVTPVAAAAVAKGTPPKPIISLIRYAPAAKGRVNITFVIAAIDAKYKTTSTEISIAYYDKSCVIKGKAKSCTVKNFDKDIEAGATARSRNTKGFGAWSKKTMFITGRSTYIRSGYNSKGVKYPSAIKKIAQNPVLQQGVGKWTKFQPLKRKSVGTSALRQAKVPSNVPSGSVIFQVSGIAGLAQSSSSNSTCNLVTPGSSPLNTCTFGVGLDGSSPSIFASGSATPSVRDFYSAPNNKFYVVFATPTPLVADGARCVLAEVNTESGIPTCVDSELTMVTMGFGSMFGPLWVGNAPIQFDDAGGIYYTGMSGGLFTLRKNVNGVVTPIVSDNITVNDYVVLGDGSIIMAGRTVSTQAAWIRKVSPTGAFSNLANGVTANFLRKFVDKNIYYGVASSASSQGGVYRYLVDQGKTDTLPWIGPSYGNVNSSQNDVSSLCTYNLSGRSSIFCSFGGSMIREIFNIGTERTMAIVGQLYGGGSTELMQYYPTIERANTVITMISVWSQIGNKLLLAGTDKDNKNILSLYDPKTFQETVLLDASNEIEIYNLGYVASANKVMFNGLRFADGKYVVGDIPL